MKAYLRLLGYLRPHWSLLVTATFMSLIILALQGISVWVGAGFIEQVISGRTPTFPTGDVGGLSQLLDAVAKKVLIKPTAFESLVAGTIVLVGARLLIMFLREFKILLIARTNQTILARIRSDLFSHITRLELSFTERVRPGEVASIFTRDIDQLNMALFDAVDRAFLQPARLIFSVGLMATLSLELTAWVILFLLIGGLVVHWIGGHIERLQKNVMEDMASLQGHLTEYLSGAILSRIFNRESDERERFDRTSRSIGKSLVKTIFAHNMAPQIIDAIFITGGGFLLILAGYRVLIQGVLTSTDVLKLALLLPMATYSMQALATMYASIRASIASAKRVFNLFDIQAMRPDPPDAVDPGPLKQGVEFKNVSYQVGNQIILRDLNFTIPQGKKVVIYGPTGSGKTTLLGLVAGYLECTEGRVEVDGIDLKKLKGASWLNGLAMVTQEPLLINGTIRENLLYARPETNDREIEEALRLALMWSDARAMSQGLDTPVGNRGDLLSGGERQRLTIARALLTDPQIILLDEPTSMLDTDSKNKIRDTILSVARGRTLILVTHDESMREIADIKFNLVDGRIEE